MDFKKINYYLLKLKDIRGDTHSITKIEFFNFKIYYK